MLLWRSLVRFSNTSGTMLGKFFPFLFGKLNSILFNRGILMSKLFISVFIMLGLFTTVSKAEEPVSCAQETTITPCSNDSEALYVEISGSSATEIYNRIAKKFKVPAAQLGGTIDNKIFCF